MRRGRRATGRARPRSELQAAARELNNILVQIQALVARGEARLSLHGFRELAADDILLDDLLGGVGSAVLIEDYFDANRGPTVLVLQRDSADRPVHVVWGIRRETSGPAVLVTAYRPDPLRWSPDFMKRRTP
jgi:hypothetical protein